MTSAHRPHHHVPVTEPADVLVIFGITGDLAHKMTFRALYRLERRGMLDIPVIGVAIDELTDAELRTRAGDAIREKISDPDPEVLDRVLARLSYVQGDYAEAATYGRVADAVKSFEHPIFYLEIPPSLFSMVVHGLGDAGLTEGSRVVIEKPFGHDLETAQELNEQLLEVLDEPQILRIDHFLGKEPVMDIAYLRFANAMLEPIWSRSHVSHVQMTMAEDLDVADRGHFYDAVGTLRDVVQNHMLQVIALIGMEPPSGNHPDAIRDMKLELFKAMRPIDPKRYIRGQYEGYHDVDGVAPGSKTETYAALEIEIDNWRWSGIPFFLRAGKCMPLKQTEVSVFFHRPPRLGFGSGARPETNHLVIRIDPTPGARIRFIAKEAGAEAFEPADLEVLFEREPGADPEPYERLLHDAIAGHMDLFTRQDMVEQTWRVVQPLLDDPPEPIVYERGSWGPDEAEHLLRGVAAWKDPWLPQEAGKP